MNTELVEAVDRVIGLLNHHPHEMMRQTVDTVAEAAHRVAVLANAAGLHHLLPSPGVVRMDVRQSHLPPAHLETVLNIPGDLEDGIFLPLVLPTGRWWQAMQVLRECAATQPAHDPVPAPAAEPKAGRPRKGPTANERMAAMIQADPALLDWSASQWAERLTDDLKRPVSAAAVKQTPMWKGTIRNARAMAAAEKVTRRRR